MTKEEAIARLKVLTDYEYDEDLEALEMAIKALEQNPCEDIAKAFQFGMALGFGEKHDKIDRVMEEVKKAVTPKEKTGHWEWVQYDGNPNIGNWHCSECRTIILHMPEKIDNIPIYKWCPMCGCHMIEPQESEDKEWAKENDIMEWFKKWEKEVTNG